MDKVAGSLPTPRSDLSRQQEPSESTRSSSVLLVYVNLLRRNLYLIILVVGLCLAVAVWLTAITPRKFEASATLEVDPQILASSLGTNSAGNTATSEQLGEYLSTQIQLIQSDAVLRPVAEQFDLLRREGQSAGLSPADEKQLRSAPTQLQQLTIARVPETTLIRVGYKSESPGLSAAVANAVLNSYLSYATSIRSRGATKVAGSLQRTANELRRRMESSSQALAAFERELNIFDPEQRTSIISARLQQLNSEATAARAERLRKQAERSVIRSRMAGASGISSRSEQLTQARQRLNAADEELAQVSATFGPSHPRYVRAREQALELRQQLQQAQQRIGSEAEADYRQSLERDRLVTAELNRTRSELEQQSQQAQRYKQLQREAESDAQLYNDVIRRIREAEITAGFQATALRIATLARSPLEPSSPNLILNLVLATLIGIILSLTAIFLIAAVPNRLVILQRFRRKAAISSLIERK